MQARIHAGADRGQHRRLGEHFGVRPDADFEILAPGILRDQHVLDVLRFGRARLQPRQVGADDPRHLGPDRLPPDPDCRAPAPRSPARASRRRSVTPAALITCRSIGASSHGLAGSRVSGGVLFSRSCSASYPLATRGAQRLGRIGFGSKLAGGGKSSDDVEHAVLADRHHRRAGKIGTPDPPPSARQLAKSSGRMKAASGDNRASGGSSRGASSCQGCLVHRRNRATGQLLPLALLHSRRNMKKAGRCFTRRPQWVVQREFFRPLSLALRHMGRRSRPSSGGDRQS